VTQDPIGFDAGDSNLYRYVNNSPTMGTDPSGLQGRLVVGVNIAKKGKVALNLILPVGGGNPGRTVLGVGGMKTFTITSEFTFPKSGVVKVRGEAAEADTWTLLGILSYFGRPTSVDDTLAPVYKLFIE